MHREIGSKFTIDQGTVYACVNDVTDTFFERMGDIIYWPHDDQADDEIQAFNNMPGNRFPGILGVIGTVDLKNTTKSGHPSKQTKDGSSIVIQIQVSLFLSFYLRIIILWHIKV